MKKILFLSFLFSIFAFGDVNPNSNENKIVKFIQDGANKQIQFDYIRVKAKYDKLENNWFAYLVEIKVKNDSKIYEDVFFTDGYYVTQGLIRLDNLKDVRNVVTENFSKKIDTSFYTKENLIFGNLNAKNKLVVFSDPLCPFCINYFNNLKENLNNFKDVAIFYYMFPLKEMHPNSEILLKASLMYSKQNQKNIDFELYKLLSDAQIYNKAMDSEQSALDIFNTVFKTNYSIKELKENLIIKNKLEEDIKKATAFNVSGTPKVYFNESLDIERNKIFNTNEK